MSKDHTCILFEDGKCIYCGKIPEYPVLNKMVCYPYGKHTDGMMIREIIEYKKLGA